MTPRVRRRKTKLVGDTSRVIARPHIPESGRIPKIIARVMNLADDEAQELLKTVISEFSDRHKHFHRILGRHFDNVAEHIPEGREVSPPKRLLIGAFFTMEYAIESAALFNPSIVPHPDQTNLKEGTLRFIMSLRATGEGHISSIVFRDGEMDLNNLVAIRSPGDFVATADIQLDPLYDRHLFQLKLLEIKAANETTDYVLAKLREQFTYHDFRSRILDLQSDPQITLDDRAIQVMLWLAASNYTIGFSPEHALSERVIFPVSENENSGIEDARFVQFSEDNGEISYYATYTAYNGVTILPQLIETKDFLTFNIMTLNGRGAQNKGLALFPRRINGMYAMLSRQDGENNYVMLSDHVRFWHEAQMIHEPTRPWEFVQVGNCGSPLEIEEGWLVLTHGVGPMRRYCIGVMLLDLDDPTRVLARLEEPLLSPQGDEREGYVPNVVYSCGALIHNGELIIPYAMSDIASGIASVGVRELVDCLSPI